MGSVHAGLAARWGGEAQVLNTRSSSTVEHHWLGGGRYVEWGSCLAARPDGQSSTLVLAGCSRVC